MADGDRPHQATPHDVTPARRGFVNSLVWTFLNSNLPLILLVLATALGITALMVTPREEDPQIVVPMADVFVSFPGHSAEEVEKLVATPLERILYQIDGVEYVYSTSYREQAVITVRFYVNEDRERSLVKLYKKIDEHTDIVPPGVAGWVVKPVEIDDVPIVTLTLAGSAGDPYVLRRVAEEAVERLAAVKNTSRAYVVGGQERKVSVRIDPQRLEGYDLSALEVQRSIAVSNVTAAAGEFARNDQAIKVDAGVALVSSNDLRNLVVGVFSDRPVFLRDVADVIDGPDEVTDYVRHGWGLARGFDPRDNAPGATIGPAAGASDTRPAVTIAIAKKKGTNAVTVAADVLKAAEELKGTVIPDDVDVVITRNSGRSANAKVNELVEALAVALVLATAVLMIGLGWREALIVVLAVPVVFGLTLTVNLLFGYTINRVTLFALILSLGLLVDDPIVDVENICRHFMLRRKATKEIVLEAVAEIRPPLIAATLAIIFSFLPLFFISGMMGPYMRPMALNVPVTMFMSMAVAFTLTPWVTYRLLRRHYTKLCELQPKLDVDQDPHAVGQIKGKLLYRIFDPLMTPLLRSRRKAWVFLGVIAALTVLTASMAAFRMVPLKMLPYGNKDQLQLVLDFDEGTTLERASAAAADFETYLRTVPEVADFTTYVGLSSPMDFNGMVRHYYLRKGDNVADIQVNLVEDKSRSDQTHAIALRIRDDLTAIARRRGVRLKLVELPPGPPVLATVVAEVTGQPGNSYAEIIAAAATVKARMAAEPGVVDVDDVAVADQTRLVFVTDKEKAALNGVSTEQIAQTLQTALGGGVVGTIHIPSERQPLLIELRLPRVLRSSTADLSRIQVKGQAGNLVQLSELGSWQDSRIDQTIYHKNLRPVAYVFAESAGRPPADVVLDISADRKHSAADVGGQAVGAGEVSNASPRPLWRRSHLIPGGRIGWYLPDDFRVNFAGEGEWKITIEVFRDMGLAFAAALVAIYILLVGQTHSFVIPAVVMLSIPLTILGIMPGFWLLNHVTGGQVGGYANPVFFTATGMIGMIALAGIVTRSSVILVDFIHVSLARGHTLAEAIVESCAVRLRPILLTAGTSMLSAVPITTDPVFSGLAWSLIFGLLASTVFTVFVVPLVYWLVYSRRHQRQLSLPRPA